VCGGFGVALVGLKVFPIVIIGGLDSVASCIVGAMVIGVLESLGTGYLDPRLGGGFGNVAVLCAASGHADAATLWSFRATKARASLNPRCGGSTRTKSKVAAHDAIHIIGVKKHRADKLLRPIFTWL